MGSPRLAKGQRWEEDEGGGKRQPLGDGAVPGCRQVPWGSLIPSPGVLPVPQGREHPGGVGSMPTSPFLGLWPHGQGVRGRRCHPPGLLTLSGGQGLVMTRCHQPALHCLQLPWHCPDPSSLPWATCPPAPWPPQAPAPGLDPAPLPSAAALLRWGGDPRGRCHCRGGKQRCQPPPRGMVGWLLPPPCPSYPQRSLAPRSLAGGLRWLPMCQKASPAPGWGLLALPRPRTLRGGVREGGTHGDVWGTMRAPVAPQLCPSEAGGALCALLPVPCSPRWTPALLPWLGGNRGAVGQGWRYWGCAWLGPSLQVGRG